MSEKIKARLSDMKEAVSDNWFVDNPNGSEVNEEITALISALEVALEELDVITDECPSDPNTFKPSTIAKSAIKQIEGVLAPQPPNSDEVKVE